MKLLFAVIPFAYATDCTTDPKQSGCKDFRLDAKIVQDSITDLCTQMPLMPGCTVKNYCADERISHRPFCTSFSVLADICAEDMPKMKGCKPYISVCPRDTMVRQCSEEKPIPSLPTTKRAKELVKGFSFVTADICDEMDMDGCEKCEGSKMNKCEVFKVYTDLCIAMPYMSQCRDYRTMCSWDPTLPFCDSELSTNGPAMKMYFHWGIRDYVLFQTWVPFSSFSYFMACLFCLFAGVGYEYLLYFNLTLEAKWRHKEEEIKLPQPDTISLQSSSAPNTPSHPVMEEDSPLMNVYPDQTQKSYWSPFSIRLCRAGMRFVTIGAAYVCMLLVMSFNVGLFFSVIFGLAVGNFVFSGPAFSARLIFKPEKEHCC
ncbi:hypothetical protein HDV01_003303 [Terramyces sp. JEL0728]|nr:hypothetical protein HDV01_003303 [Terramyces sp. JEL0728]